MTPLEAARINSGSAALNATTAASLSPLKSASSTLRMKVRTRERRDLLISVRAVILRTAFLAEGVLAINASLFLSANPRANTVGHKTSGQPQCLGAADPCRAYSSAFNIRQCGICE